jgi:hypothetical protein
MTLRAETPADNIDPAKMNEIAEDAMQAAFALIGARLQLLTGLHVYGDVAPWEMDTLTEQFRGYVRHMAENISPEAAEVKVLMTAVFDVTHLSDNERNALAGEVSVQAEESDFVGDDGHGWTGHRDVPAPKVEFTDVERYAEEREKFGNPLVEGRVWARPEA